MAIEKIRPRVVDETGNYTFHDANVTGSLTASTANLGNLVTANYVKTNNLQYANGTPYPLNSGSVSGTNTQVQFNDDNALGAKSTFTFNKATDTLAVTNITANGAGLTSLPGGNVTGTVANATYATSAGTATSATTAGTVTTNAQPNITSTGTLTSLTITDNGNVTMSGTASQISGVNTVIANYFVGNGYNLTSTAGGNVVGKVETANVAYSVSGSNVVGAVAYAATANAVAGSNVMGQVANALSAGTVYEPAQTNITSVGTLSSLSVSGNVSASYFLGNGSQLTGIVSSYSNTNVAAYLPTHTGNVSANYLFGNGSQLTGIVSTYSNANVSNYLPTYTGNLTAGNANITGSLTANSISTLGSGGNLSGVGYAIANYFVGNAYYLTGVDLLAVGNADIANSIANGTSNINTPYLNGPITVGIGGTSNAVVFSNSGNFITTTGNVSASYYFGDGSQLTNINAGAVTGSYSNTNVAAYLPTYTGNITAGNVKLSYTTTATANLGNAVRANYFVGNGAYLTGVDLLTVGNADIANAIANGTSNINTPYLNGPITVGIGGTANTVVFSSTGINLSYTTTATANLGNAVRANYFVGNGAYLTGVDLLSVGNADIANAIANGTSNINTPYLNGPITVGIGGTANIVVFNTTGINLKYTTTSTANLGNAVRANYFVGNGAYLTGVDLLSVGNADGANYISNGTSNINTPYTNGPITVGIGGTANTVVFSSTGINLKYTTTATANLGNAVRANYFVGNGAYLTGVDLLSVGNADIANAIANGTSNINTPYASGPITVGVGGTSNTVIFTSTGINVKGYITPSTGSGSTNGIIWPANPGGGTLDVASIKYYAVSGEQTRFEINVQNDVPGASQDDIYFTTNSYVVVNSTMEATSTSAAPFQVLGGAGIAKKLYVGGNIEAGTNYIKGNGYYLTGVDQLVAGSADVANLIANGTSNINTPYLNGPITVGIGGTANTVVFSSTGINLSYTTTATANLGNAVRANYFVGNGAYLTGVDLLTVSGADAANYIANGTSNINTPYSGGPITVGIGGTSNTVVFNNAGNYITTTGNVKASYYFGDGSQLTGISGTYSNTNVAAYLPTYTGNITAGNVSVIGTVNAASFNTSGTGGNLTGANYIIANYFVGNGAYITGVDLLTVGNADIANAIANGTSNINTPYSNGSITVSIGGTSNIVVFANAGNYITTTGNVSASYYFGDGSQLTGISGTYSNSNVSSYLTANPPTGTYSNSNVAAYLPTYTGNLVGNNLTLTGNLIVSGTTTYVNSTITDIKDPIIELGGGTNAAALTSDDNKDRGVLLHYYSGSSTVDAFMGWDDSNAEFAFASNASLSSEVATFNSFGNVRAAYFIGNGSQLTGISGAYSNSNVASYLPTYTGNVSYAITSNWANVANSVTWTNISSKPTTVSGYGITDYYSNTNANALLTAYTGNITAGNINLSYTTTATANLGNAVRANYFVGDGSQLTGISGTYSNSTVAAYLPTYTGNITAGNINLSYTTTATANLGNAVIANYFVGNGAYLSGVDLLTVGGADGANYISNGTSNINTPYLNGPITVGIGGTANAVVFANTGNYITTSGNLKASYLFGNGSQLTGVVSATLSNGTSNINAPYLNGPITIGIGGTSNAVVFNNTGNYITTTGNVKASYYFGDGSSLTGISATTAVSVTNGNSNVTALANSNITVSVNGTANTVVFTNSGNYIVTSGNVKASYYFGDGSQLSGVDTSNIALRIANGTSNVNIPGVNGNITFTVGGTGNVAVVTSTGIVVTGSGSISAAGGTVTGGSLAGTIITAAQTNITSLGPLSSLTVNANATVGNLVTSGNVYANSGVVKGQYLYGDGSNLTGLGGAGYIFNGTSNVYIPASGANVYFTVGLTANVMTVANTGVNVAGYINAGSGAITTTGNVTSGNANLGNLVTANYFSGTLYGRANTAGTVTTNAQPNITSLGTLANLNVNGSANLGAVGNVTITGGASGYFLKTDGTGNLSWDAPSGGGGGGASITYTADTTPPGSANILGDQWFNTLNNVLYEYISDGTSSYWVDVSGATTTSSSPTTLNLSNIIVTGGTSGQSLVSNGSGGLSFATLTSNIYNGNSNVSVNANSNVAFSVAGIANVLIVTSTGANLLTTGSANLGNLVTANYFTGTLTTASQPNITTVGTLANLTVSGITTYGLSADILVTKTGATGTVTHDVSAGAVFYHTSPSANFTANFTNVSTTTDRVLTLTLLISQGATPYMCTAVQIDSIVQTIKWIGGLTATGSASKLDIVSFSLVRTGGSWIVTGQSAYYG